MIFVVNILTVMVQLLKKIYFPLEKNGQRKIDLGRNSYGVTRWQYEELDDVK